MYLFFVYSSSKFLNMSIEPEVNPEARGHMELEREETPERSVVGYRCYAERNGEN